MDQERDRQDRSDEERGDRTPEPDWTADSHEDASRPVPIDATTPEGDASSDAWGGTAEGDARPPSDAWTDPEQPERVIEEPEDAAAPTADAGTERGWPASEQAASGAPAEIESWPSQEPTADEPTWPAEPEREPGREVEPGGAEGWDRREPPPEEVEAHPASGAPVAEAAASAGASAQAVPDSEGATGESTQCPRCGTENRPGLSFCRSCGQRLVAAGVASTVDRPGTPEGTMACPRCGTHNRAGVAFCQNCGANLRGTAEGYVPPAAAEERVPAAEPARRGAILGPVVLLIGLVGLVTAYLLPFLYGAGNSLFERSWGAGGYGIAFWNGYPDVNATLADQAYFGLAGPVPLLGLLLVVLAVAGFVRAAPGPLQLTGLVIALLWSIGLIVLFVIVELAANWGGDLVGVLRVLTPAGIIFFLSSLIVLIGALTRFSRG
jgi:hypothetical protein